MPTRARPAVMSLARVARVRGDVRDLEGAGGAQLSMSSRLSVELILIDDDGGHVVHGLIDEAEQDRAGRAGCRSASVKRGAVAADVQELLLEDRDETTTHMLLRRLSRAVAIARRRGLLGERDEHVLERRRDGAHGGVGEAGARAARSRSSSSPSVRVDHGVHRLAEDRRAAAERLRAQPGERARGVAASRPRRGACRAVHRRAAP